MKTVSLLVVAGVWAFTEPSTAIVVVAGTALLAALLISLRRA